MATSKLQRYTSEHLSIWFGGLTIKENYRPDWLITKGGNRLELDFFIEELSVAIEVQGMQHYEFVKHFHGDYEKFITRQVWDKFKRDTCKRFGVVLYEVFDTDGVNNTIIALVKLHRGIKVNQTSMQSPIKPEQETKTAYKKLPKTSLNKCIKTIIYNYHSRPEVARAAVKKIKTLSNGCNQEELQQYMVKVFQKLPNGLTIV